MPVPTPPPTLLEVRLPDDVLGAVERHVGPGAAVWRVAIVAGAAKPLHVSPEVGGPWIRGRVLQLDPRLYRAATAALEALAVAAGCMEGCVRTDLAPLIDALVDAQARRIAAESPLRRK